MDSDDDYMYDDVDDDADDDMGDSYDEGDDDDDVNDDGLVDDDENVDDSSGERDNGNVNDDDCDDDGLVDHDENYDDSNDEDDDENVNEDDYYNDGDDRKDGYSNYDLGDDLRQTEKVYIEYDGSSKGNPGRAGAGAVLKSEGGNVITRVRKGLGRGTNNEAEYEAVIEGMKAARDMGYDHVHVKGDSQLVHKQVSGEWNTHNENMSRYCNEARQLKSQFKSCKMEHVPRGSNRDADVEANKAVNLPPGHVEKEGGSQPRRGHFH